MIDRSFFSSFPAFKLRSQNFSSSDLTRNNARVFISAETEDEAGKRDVIKISLVCRATFLVKSKCHKFLDEFQLAKQS